MLAFFHRKFIVFKRFVHETVISPSGISVEPYMLYNPLVCEAIVTVLKSVVVLVLESVVAVINMH